MAGEEPAYTGSFVYFIQQGDDGPVKIGVATDPQERLGALQIGNPDPLYLRQAVPGSFPLEYELHSRFGEWHVRGEWFGGGETSVAILAFAAGMEQHREEFGWRAEILRLLRDDIERLRLRGMGPNAIAYELAERSCLSRERIAEEVRRTAA